MKFPKWFVVLLIVLLAGSVLLTGCSQGTPEATEDKTLTVGVTIPLTGPNARVGVEFKNALDMAFSEVDYKIQDYNVELVWINDETDVQKAVTGFEQAIQRDKIDVGLQGWGSSLAVALMDVCAKYEIPYLFHTGATGVVNEKYASDPKYSYWMGKSWAGAEKLSVNYATMIDDVIKNGTFEPKNNKIALWGEDTDWGRSFGAIITESFKDIGFDTVYEEYVKVGETDLYPVLAKIKSENPAIVIGAACSPVTQAAFIKQIREVNVDALIINDGLSYIGNWYELTGEASDGLLDMAPLFTDKGETFIKDFKDKYDLDPSASVAGLMYDYTKFFIKIMNGTLDEYGELNSENIYKYTQENVMTGKVTYDEGILLKKIKYDADSIPDPVVDNEHFFFSIVQYFDGEPVAIWPDNEKQADLVVPE